MPAICFLLTVLAFVLGVYAGFGAKEIVDKVRARKEKENSVKESDAAENNSQGE